MYNSHVEVILCISEVILCISDINMAVESCYVFLTIVLMVCGTVIVNFSVERVICFILVLARRNIMFDCSSYADIFQYSSVVLYLVTAGVTLFCCVGPFNGSCAKLIKGTV